MTKKTTAAAKKAENQTKTTAKTPSKPKEKPGQKKDITTDEPQSVPLVPFVPPLEQMEQAEQAPESIHHCRECVHAYNWQGKTLNPKMIICYCRHHCGGRRLKMLNDQACEHFGQR